MKITFIGHGYVGLVTASLFADLGNTVYVIGHTQEKVDNLNKGIIPIYEPGLTEIVKRNVDAGRLQFSLDYEPFIQDSEIVFTAVGTPPTPGTGEADLSIVLDVVKKIALNLSGYTVIATKSTVPIGTNKIIRKIIEENKPEKAEFDLASVPEFLREGTAINDTLYPDRVVIGTDSPKARKLLIELHKPINGERVLTNLDTAEMIKYAANSFLATKISFANAIAELSEKVGSDALKVMEGIGLDKRIGKLFLQPGVGYGGSCFPKDVKALIAIGKQNDYDFKLLKEVEEINARMRKNIVKKIEDQLGDVKGKTIGILGLAFKPDTDDMRDAPSKTIIEALKEKGAIIKAYDQQARGNAKKVIKDVDVYTETMYEAIEDADAMVVVTDWNEFKEIDFVKVKTLLKNPVVIDGRNIYDPEKMEKLGFTYKGVGR
jgi:UDPglucose 6-dehydrogenase